MIAEMTDNFIPADQRQMFLAEGSYYLAQAIHRLAEAEGIPPDEKQKAGQEAIELARQALKIHTRLHGAESSKVAYDMTVLGDVLDYFNDIDDDEVPCLVEQANVIFRRLEGSSVNVAVSEYNLGLVYVKRANRAKDANDSDRNLANLELALPHYREAARIYRVICHTGNAEEATQCAARTEERIKAARAAAAAALAAVAAATTRV